MQKTSIDWTDLTWNPVTGCSGPDGQPCPWCYAKRISGRFKRSFEPTFHPERLEQPLQHKKPQRIFACSMGDLFDPAITDEQIDDVFQVMVICQQHVFQVLTKRPERMRQWAKTVPDRRPIPGQGVCTGGSPFCMGPYCKTHESDVGWCGSPWPLPNVWLGVSITTQADADERIPYLLQTPAAVRWLSVEPLLEPVDLRPFLGLGFEAADGTLRRLVVPNQMNPYLDWVVVGGLTPTPVHKPEWIDTLVAQCDAAGVPVFIKANAGYPIQRQQFPEVQP